MFVMSFPRGMCGNAPRVVSSPHVDNRWRVVSNLPRVDRWRVVSPRVDNRWRVVSNLPRGKTGDAPRVVFLPRGHARCVVLNLRGTLGNAPHGVFFSKILVDDDPRDDDALIKFKFLVDDDPGDDDALVKSSFARLHKSMSTTFSIEFNFLPS